MLKVDSLTYRHANSERLALKNVSFSLEQGQSMLLAGRSGSGKSTLLSILAGLHPHFLKGTLEGRAELDGQEAGQGGVAEWGKGARLMLQNPEAQFLAGTVEEEILLTLRCRGVTGPEAQAIASDRLRSLGISALKGHSVFKLSEGQKQKAVLAALTALRPKLLLLDEPSANLDPMFLEELKGVLKSLQKDGLSLIVADHRLYWLKGLCEKTLALEEGEIAFEGKLADLEEGARRRKLGLRSPVAPQSSLKPNPQGLRLPEPWPPGPGPGAAGQAGAEGQGSRKGQVLGKGAIARVSSPGQDYGQQEASSEGNWEVRVESLRFNYPHGQELFGGLSFALAAGEVTALTGPSGRGKTTLARLLCGLEKPKSGAVTYGGAMASLEMGQVVLQNADHQLYMPTVLGEVILALGQGKRDPEKKARAMGILEAFGLAPLAGRHPQSLSGGEKQRLVVAVGLARPTKLLALDEPTSGLDGHNLELMASRIREAAKTGPATLVVTHDLELVNLCADRQLELVGPAALNPG
ncbi:MAG: ATP-binding cassette domain-containing protein [Deltaproteobacteria bacterium]|jgi:energy-coupling factor transport system ATP-binding protein|nr:ATP-binding cassette domain-containing protein [Deltaproteobacteria bacterium]